MLPAATTLLVVLLAAPVPPIVVADATVPTPASCSGFKVPPPSDPGEHSPYPAIGKRWPMDVSKAEIVKDERVARRDEYFAPVSIQDVREKLSRYVVVSREEWQHGFSHVAFGDEGGWLVTQTGCFQWMVRPGGLAWIVYPDGTAVYLAAFRPNVRGHQ